MLIGRRAEQDALDAMLQSARRERSAVLVLRGEPGIGKSALLDYAAANADGMRILRCSGVEAEHELPFAAIHQLVRPCIGLLDRLPPPQAAALRAALGLSFGGVDDRFLVSLGLLSLLAEACEERPVLCCIDDAQWLDLPSAEALTFAARRLQAESIAVLIAAREGDPRRFEAPGLAALVLGGLDDEDAHALVAARLDRSVAPEVVDQLLRAAGGNPLALLELPAGLTGTVPAGREAILGSPRAGGTVEAAFGARVERLPAETRTALLIAAVDEMADLPTIERAAQRLGAGVADLDPAEREGLVRINGTVGFRHPLVRSAIYRGATLRERRGAHEALAEVLDDPVRAAWHRAVVADRADEGVAAGLEAAAVQAGLRGAPATASAAFERAAELTEDTSRKGHRLRCAAQAALAAGRPDTALAIVERAAPLVADVADTVELDIVRSRVAAARGMPSDAYAPLLRSVAASAQVQPERALLMLIGMIVVAGSAGWPDRAIAEAAEAIELIDSANDGRRSMSAFLDGTAALMAGDAAGAGDRLREAAALFAHCEGEGFRRMGGLACLYAGELARARELFADALGEYRAQGTIVGVSGVIPLCVHVEIAERRVTAAAALAAEGVEITSQLGYENQATALRAAEARIAALRGHEDECREAAGEALRRALANGLRTAASTAHVALAELELGLGRPEIALEHFERIDPTPFPPIAAMAAPDVVDAALRVGDRARAVAAVDRLAAWAPVSSSPPVRAMLARCRALIADDPGECERLHRAALDLDAPDTPPYERARSQLAFGEFLRRARRRIEARAELHDALETFDGLGCAGWAERARGELLATGATARRRDATAIDQLTPQELRIAQLAGAGASNRDVGAQLFVSQKTVEYHLRKVFRKLGVASRVELAHLQLPGQDQGSD